MLWPIVKKNKLYYIIIIIAIAIIILKNIYDFYKIKYINATIISNSNNYIEIITKNDSIYKLKHSNNFKTGDKIKIKYNKKLNDFIPIQKIKIKEIKKIRYKFNSSEKAIDIINNMTLNEKIGQLLLVPIPANQKLEAITNYNIGGYILFKRDIDNKTENEIINEIKTYQDKAKIPLFISIDEEGGSVSRISKNKNIVNSTFLSPKELYKLGGYSKIKEDARIKLNLLKKLGININLYPIADITTNPKSYMYKRSFGKNKKATSKYIKTILSTQTNNFKYVLKHFPGYSNNLDTHQQISIDKRSYRTIKRNDFLPFKVGIKNKAEIIMVSHQISSNIENKSSSISRNVHNILRNELNFKGIIMTDDLSMNGVSNYNINPYVDAILAGNNILIVSDYIHAYKNIKAAVIKGKISEHLINQLIMKNIQMKINMKLLK